MWKIIDQHYQTVSISSLLGLVLILVGLLGIWASQFLENPYSTAFPIAIVVGGGLFLIMRLAVDTPVAGRHESQLTPQLLGIGYSLTVVVVVLAYYGSGFETTLFVNLLVLCLYLLTTSAVLIFPARVFTLPMVMATGLLHRELALYSSPILMGNDTFFHNRVARSIAETGSLDPLTTSKYYYAPFYHVFNALSGLVFDLPGRDIAALTTVVIITVVPAYSLYWLLDSYWNPRVGALGALLYVSSDFALFWAIEPQVTSLGVSLYALNLCAVIAYMRNRSKWMLALAIVTLGTVTLTHQVSTFITVFSVMVYLIFRTAYARVDIQRALNLVLTYTLVLLFSFQNTRWSGPAGDSEDFFHIMVTEVIYSVIKVSEGSTSRVAYTIPDDPGIVSVGSNALTLIHVAGSAALLTASVTGTLLWMQTKRDRSKRATGFAIGGMVAVMFAVVLIGPIFGLRTILPWRWFAYIYVPMAMLGGVFLASIVPVVASRVSNASAWPVIAVLLLVGPYVVVMGGNFTGAVHDPVFDSAPGAERYRITSTEKAMLDHSLQYVPASETIVADRVIALILWRHYTRPNTEVITITYGDPTTLGKQNDSVVLFDRTYLSSDHAQYSIVVNGVRVYVFGSVPTEAMSPNRRRTIYDTGSDELVYLQPQIRNTPPGSRGIRNSTGGT